MHSDKREERKLTVLFSPMAWGLGHASRIILPVQMFREEGHSIILAADGASYFLLKATFPELEIILLKDVQIHYSRIFPLWFKMFMQLPAFFTNIYREHRLVRRLIREKGIDLIVSDNRYGLYNKQVHSIMITHQIRIRFPRIFRLFEGLAFTWHKSRLRKFHEVWVPDFHDPTKSLAGKLSHVHRLKKVSITFTGPLSRFLHPSFTGSLPKGTKYDVFVIMSGPEPSRSVFEQLMTRKLRNLSYRVIMLRGLPWKTTSRSLYQNIKMVTHLNPEVFFAFLKEARYVISRSGYTTVMDLVAMKKKALLVPTPGQPEQEYLGAFLDNGKGFVTMHQDEVDITEAFERLDNMTWGFPETDLGNLQEIVHKTVQSINQSKEAARVNPPRNPR